VVEFGSAILRVWRRDFVVYLGCWVVLAVFGGVCVFWGFFWSFGCVWSYVFCVIVFFCVLFVCVVLFEVFVVVCFCSRLGMLCGVLAVLFGYSLMSGW